MTGLKNMTGWGWEGSQQCSIMITAMRTMIAAFDLNGQSWDSALNIHTPKLHMNCHSAQGCSSTITHHTYTTVTTLAVESIDCETDKVRHMSRDRYTNGQRHTLYIQMDRYTKLMAERMFVTVLWVSGERHRYGGTCPWELKSMHTLTFTTYSCWQEPLLPFPSSPKHPHLRRFGKHFDQGTSPVCPIHTHLIDRLRENHGLSENQRVCMRIDLEVLITSW